MAEPEVQRFAWIRIVTDEDRKAAAAVGIDLLDAMEKLVREALCHHMDEKGYEPLDTIVVRRTGLNLLHQEAEPHEQVCATEIRGWTDAIKKEG